MISAHYYYYHTHYVINRGTTGERPGNEKLYILIFYPTDISYEALFIYLYPYLRTKVYTKVINLAGKDRGKTNVIISYLRGDKLSSYMVRSTTYVIPHRGITGEFPRSFPDLFLTRYLILDASNERTNERRYP